MNGSRDDRGGIVERLRSSRPLAVAVVGAAMLLIAWIAWIAWAIHVASDNGATAGLGVVIAWPALLAALALISLPFIGAYVLVRGRGPDEGSAAAPADAEEIAIGEVGEETEEDDEPEAFTEAEDADDAGSGQVDDEAKDPDESDDAELPESDEADFKG